MKMRTEPTDRRNTRLTAVVLLTGIAGNVEGEAAWWQRHNVLEERVAIELAGQERAPLCTPSRARRATMIYDG